MNFWSFLSNPDRWIRGHVRRAVKQAVFGDVIAEYKGERGEKKVSRIADRTFANTTAVPIKNLCLPWPDGRTAQIDELVIADSGIYVIEVKNYKGWIFGNENNQYWTQVLSPLESEENQSRTGCITQSGRTTPISTASRRT